MQNSKFFDGGGLIQENTIARIGGRRMESSPGRTLAGRRRGEDRIHLFSRRKEAPSKRKNH